MEEIIITTANEEERNWAARLMAGSEPWITLGVSLSTCMEACHHPDYLLFIAHTGNVPCGMMILHPRGVASSPYLKTIAVDFSVRGKGVGSIMLGFAEKLFSSQSKHFFLCVSSFNSDARAFYERHGYRLVGEFEDYIIEGASEILMYKRLK